MWRDAGRSWPTVLLMSTNGQARELTSISAWYVRGLCHHPDAGDELVFCVVINRLQSAISRLLVRMTTMTPTYPLEEEKSEEEGRVMLSLLSFREPCRSYVVSVATMTVEVVT